MLMAFIFIVGLCIYLGGLVYGLHEIYRMCSPVSNMGEIHQTHSALIFFPSLPSGNNPLYSVLNSSLQLHPILIEHKQECLKSFLWTTATLHFICMFILPVRGPLFMDNWRAQIIISHEQKICFYYLQSFAMPLCTLTLPPDCLFIIPAFLLSQWGSGQFLKVPSLFQPFPVCDIIVYTSKIHWSVSCLQPGWHTSHATKVKHKVHPRCHLDMLDAIRSHARVTPSLFMTSMPLSVMKRWPVVDPYLLSVLCFYKTSSRLKIVHLTCPQEPI